MAKRILVVDDEEHIRQLIRLTLETAGYDVGEAEDGYRGLEAFGDGRAWDVVLLDQRMPGLDGLETLRSMRERSPGARVVMVTAFASIELAVDAMKLGATDFLRKPMTPEMLRNAVTAALAKPAVAGPPVPPPAVKPTEVPAPPIARLTLNGFRFWRAPEAATHSSRPQVHPFLVQHPEGREEEVLIEFTEAACEHVERRTHRQFPLAHRFWALQAEYCLNRYLWNEGKIPPTRKLIVREIDRDGLQMAARWQDD